MWKSERYLTYLETVGTYTGQADGSPVKGKGAAWHSISYECGGLGILTTVDHGIRCTFNGVYGADIPDNALYGRGTRGIARVGLAIDDDLVDKAVGGDVGGGQKESEDDKDGIHREGQNRSARLGEKRDEGEKKRS